MKVHYFLPVVLLLVSSAAIADPTARDETIAALVRATGLEEMLEQSRQQAREQAGQISDQMLQEVLKGANALTPDQNEAIASASRTFAQSCAETLDVKDAISAWSRFYAANLSDEELKQILAYYTSPVGRKDVAASQAALPQWQAHLAATNSMKMQAAIEKYVADLKQIVAKRGT